MRSFTHSLAFAGRQLEVRVEADAGIRFGDSSRWWGSRIEYRTAGSREHWRHFIAIDVHPFDGEVVELALRAHLANEREKRAGRRA